MSSDRVNRLIITAGGLGLLPVASGTWGALAGVAIHVAIALAAPSPWVREGALAAALVAVVIVGMRLAPWAERFYGAKDPSPFVLDEVAGYLLVPVCFPVASAPLWAVVVMAFFSSRALDIVKPPPARQAERLSAGWGIMADDLIASVYAAGGCHVLWFVILPALGLR